MNYAEYKEMTKATPIDRSLYQAMLIDVASNGDDRLYQILEVFEVLSVPENYDGDVQEIYSEGLTEIQRISYSEEFRDLADYVPMIWALSPNVSNSVYNTLEQMIPV